jgi:L-fuculose-phosphate aldolase
MATAAKPTLPAASAIDSIVRRVLAQHLGKAEALNSSPTDWPAGDLFHSEPVNELKAQIVAAGRRLWQREYVDGNGGNISARVNDELVLCTPTLCSKGDLREEELSLVNLENRQVLGIRPQTSEIQLHLEIYKAVPQARAVIHCHPPYATAHAIARVVPQGNLIPEQELFIGPVALAPYETPGTVEFARTILPFVRKHNTVLLANHGIVCWADTVQHAGWYVEVIENYCKTVMIAKQLRDPLPEIPPDKILDLLAIKKKLGLPDARFPDEEIDLPIRHPASCEGIGSYFQPESPVDEQINGLDEIAADLTVRIVRLLEDLS